MNAFNVNKKFYHTLNQNNAKVNGILIFNQTNVSSAKFERYFAILTDTKWVGIQPISSTRANGMRDAVLIS